MAGGAAVSRLGSPEDQNFLSASDPMEEQPRRHRDLATIVSIVGDNGSPASSFPLQKCQGDCDTDAECAAGLICFPRTSEEVPGCTGITSAMDGIYFCNDPWESQADSTPASTTNSTASYTLDRVGNNGIPAENFPLQKCQGDCDDDSECAGSLECFQRNPGDSRKIPGCKGTPLTGDTDYCYDPNDASQQPSSGNPQLNDKGSNWLPVKSYPLGLCEGDCDGDSDCEGDLVCHQRDGNDAVPSCGGTGTYNNDYCIRPESETAKPPVTGAFRIKMFWAPGFDWQFEFWETEWCMKCDGQGCGAGDYIYLHACSETSTWFEFENMSDGKTQIKVAKTKYCLQITELYNAIIEKCDALEPLQFFNAGDGSFLGEKFELMLGDGCLTQDHHPKDSEQVFLQVCSEPRWSHTSFWGKY